VTAEMPGALIDILPRMPEVTKCEIQLLASNMNSDSSMRNNAFSDIIDLTLVNSFSTRHRRTLVSR